MEDAAIGMAIEPRGVATTTSASGPPAGASDSAGMRYVPRPTSSLPCLSPSRGRTHASASHCFRDGPAQDRGGTDRDVGDHRRSREHPAAELGQRGERVRSGFAAVAPSARCGGSPPSGQFAHYITNRYPGKGFHYTRQDRGDRGLDGGKLRPAVSGGDVIDPAAHLVNPPHHLAVGREQRARPGARGASSEGWVRMARL